MLKQLQAMEGTSGLRVRVVNIDTDPLLQQHYGQRIPVLIAADDGRVLSETRLDTGTLRRYLADEPGSRDR